MQHLELPITGMSCASCANRVERSLNDVDGVVATVNYATERATVRADDSVSTDALIAEVAAIGYTASLPVAAHEAHGGGHDHMADLDDGELR